jgi:endonuclease III
MPSHSSPTKGKPKSKKDNKSAKAKTAKSRAAQKAATKQPKRAATKKLNPNDLPHGLGVTKDEDYVPPAKNGTKKLKLKVHEERNADGKASITAVESSKAKVKAKKSSQYGVKLGVTPYPELLVPTPIQCIQVNQLLTDAHGEVKAPENIPVPSKNVAGCGEVKFILEALVRTHLSAHTSMSNANRAIQGLLNRFPVFESGPCEGSVDWNEVRKAPRTDLEEAIKGGGMAPTKSKHIKQMLDMVYVENKHKREELRAAKLNTATSKEAEEKVDEVEVASNPLSGDTKSAIMARFANEILLESEDILTLDYMHAMEVHEAFDKFLTYPGIGVKTAACTLLFCMQRPLFAVDTHVFRLCKWLKWVPETATRDTTFAHCDVRVPDDLKYSLHQLMIVHGKTCDKCRANTTEAEEDDKNDGTCPIEHLVKRIGKRKAGDRGKKISEQGKVKSKKRKADVDDNTDDDNFIPDVAKRTKTTISLRSKGQKPPSPLENKVEDNISPAINKRTEGLISKAMRSRIGASVIAPESDVESDSSLSDAYSVETPGDIEEKDV